MGKNYWNSNRGRPNGTKRKIPVSGIMPPIMGNINPDTLPFRTMPVPSGSEILKSKNYNQK